MKLMCLLTVLRTPAIRRLVIGINRLSAGALFLLHQHGHDGLDGMHAVFGFVKDDGTVALEHFVGDFHLRDAELLMHLAADAGTQVDVGLALLIPVGRARGAGQSHVKAAVGVGNVLQVSLLGHMDHPFTSHCNADSAPA